MLQATRYGLAKFGPRKDAIFGHCGDARSFGVQMQAGFQPEDDPHLLAYWPRSARRKAAARIVRLGERARRVLVRRVAQDRAQFVRRMPVPAADVARHVPAIALHRGRRRAIAERGAHAMRIGVARKISSRRYALDCPNG